MTSARAGSRYAARGGYPAWLGADVVLIALFALLGHHSHYGTLSPLGIATTALPFLSAYLFATAILRPWRHPSALVRSSLLLWVATAAGGLMIRVLFGESAALPFQIVTVCVLALFLIAPRAIAALLHRRHLSQPATLSPSHTKGAAP